MRAHQATVSNPYPRRRGRIRDAATATRQHRPAPACGRRRVSVRGHRRHRAHVVRCAVREPPSLVIAERPTAGRIHRIRRSPCDGVVYFISPPASQPCREPWASRTAPPALDQQDIIVRFDGVRLTTASRTVVDLESQVAERLPELARSASPGFRRSAGSSKSTCTLSTARSKVSRTITGVAGKDAPSVGKSNGSAKMSSTVDFNGVMDDLVEFNLRPPERSRRCDRGRFVVCQLFRCRGCGTRTFVRGRAARPCVSMPPPNPVRCRWRRRHGGTGR